MNTNPWNTPDAFFPMFTDEVVITGNRKKDNATRSIKCVCKAMVLDDGLDMADYNAESDVYMWVITIQKCSWSDTSKPQQGDAVEFVNDEAVNYKVSRVVDIDDYYRLFCRSR